MPIPVIGPSVSWEGNRTIKQNTQYRTQNLRLTNLLLYRLCHGGTLRDQASAIDHIASSHRASLAVLVLAERSPGSEVGEGAGLYAARETKCET